MDGSEAMGSWRREDPPPPNPAHVHPPVSQQARILGAHTLDLAIEKRKNQRALLQEEILDLEAAKRLLREAL